MKNSITIPIIKVLIAILYFGLFVTKLEAQDTNTKSDSTYLPQITLIADPSCYGPYYINTKHTNIYLLNELPKNTSKVIMQYVDSKGKLLGEAHIEEGSDIQDVVWVVESEEVGFALSPKLNIEIHYNGDSVAIYNIPYIVYPDTVKFITTAGWGPFVSNNYPLADNWQPVAPLSNTFTVKNLPPRTDTLEFQILDADSAVIKSLRVIAADGEYLDSAVFANVRMDSLPLSTRILRTLIWCEGGPDEGLEFHKNLVIVPQEPGLISKTESSTLIDSIGTFVENQFVGQALGIDKINYASISNVPGVRYKAQYNETIYRGPYSFDIFIEDYSIESWLKFDLEKIQNTNYAGMTFMSVDSVWSLYFYYDENKVSITLKCMMMSDFNEIFTADIPFEVLMADEWHHIAVTSDYSGSGVPQMDFYFDGEKCTNTTFHTENYWRIRNSLFYTWYLRTEPLYLGTSPSLLSQFDKSFIVAMDEIRLWKGTLSAEDVKVNFHKKVLQSDTLVGYWNFDDFRNRLGYISGLSYKNNTGRLKKAATFIPQYPLIQTTPDTIIYQSSIQLSDSVIYSFIDQDGGFVYTDTADMTNGGDTLLFDVSALPENISKLRVSEYAPGSSDTGFICNYNLECLAPTPIATPKFNWNTFYYSLGNMGKFYNAYIVSGLPEKTTKVVLGLKKGDEYFNTESSTENSIPYQYSLTLNGSNNYIETSQHIDAPEKLTLSLWFKTTTNLGGKIIGFSDSRQGKSRANHDREIIMEEDGSLRFYLRTDDSTYILSAENKYNDGRWHDVAVTVDAGEGASLYLDGSIVDYSAQAHGKSYSGYWTIGRNADSKHFSIDDETVADYFRGSLCEIVITNYSSNNDEINANRYGLVEGRETQYHYKLNEGKGIVVNDCSGNNTATLIGNSQKWFIAGSLSTVVWNHNIIDKVPGTYDFFTRVFYVGGPTEGVYYPLGRIHIKNPFPEHNFTYKMIKGFGYFNEGTKLSNWLEFWINNTDSDSANWKDNFLKYKFLTPDHQLVDEDIFTYTDEQNASSMQIDMGDAPPGSYLSLEVGFHTNDNKQHVTNQLSFPLYFNPILAPIVTGNFGPFDQAIAPGTMEQMNTFVIATEILSDLNKVTAKFYDKHSKVIGETDAVQINDTTWHITYDMAKLSPKTTKMKVEYFLGPDPRPALVQGPFIIHIKASRPKWFDFIPDTSFHNIQQTGGKVTFSLSTPFEKSYLINNSESVDIPESVPLLGGTSCEMRSPTAEVYLKYTVSEYKLELDTSKPPKFFQKVFNLGAGEADFFRFGFNYSQNNSYSLDSRNNLLAEQNFAISGSATSGLEEIENLAERIKELIELIGMVDPETILITPSFDLTLAGQFGYSSRQHLGIYPATGKWGSFGNLKIDANPEHEYAYKNSASFKFYSLTLGFEFSTGLTLLDGLVAGNFGTDGRLVLGFGHSYVTIPRSDSRHLKSFAFQLYGRFYMDYFWGWYEKTLWGPKLFSTTILWGDDMRDAFPDLGKKEPSSIKANSSWTELADEIKPVRKFSKMPMPVPEPNIVFSNNQQLFTWVERGKTYGERKLCARYLDSQNSTFKNTVTIELNNNALNNSIADAIDKNLSFFCWAQTRHDNKSILKVKPDDVLKEFVKSQDIWYAIYDQEKDSILVMSMVNDNTKSLTSGRAEANPVACVLTNSRVMIAWQVADVDNHQSELWYVLLEESGGIWSANTPQAFVTIDGIATQLEIVSTGTDKAMVTWLNTSKDDSHYNKVMTAAFDGTEWSSPETLIDDEDEYYNYQSLNIDNGLGGLVVATFVKDSNKLRYEKVLLKLWDGANNQWSGDKPLKILVDSVNHLQLPQMTINGDGRAIIAVKAEKLVLKDVSKRISQVDLLIGDLNNPLGYWKRIEANEYVCDTTKQLVDLQITYLDNNILMLLSNEYPMLPTNSKFVPANGKMFGDPYMNLVLRSFAVDELGDLYNVDENDFFTAINEIPESKSKVRLYQNYPNPCVESTTITFDIPADSKVILELFDIKGNKVATLAEQQMSTGRYEINLNTSLLKPGTYIYRLTADGSSSTLRMIVGN